MDVVILVYPTYHKSLTSEILIFLFRLYALPAIEDKRHPCLRSISCDTLAHLIKGDYNHVVNSFRLVINSFFAKNKMKIWAFSLSGYQTGFNLKFFILLPAESCLYYEAMDNYSASDIYTFWANQPLFLSWVIYISSTNTLRYICIYISQEHSRDETMADKSMYIPNDATQK